MIRGDRMKKSLIIILLATVFTMIVAYVIGGIELILEGLKRAKNTAVSSSLMLVTSFILIGQLNVLLTKELMDKWLQRFKGIKGILVSAIAGGLFPGGPYIYYPFISNFLDKNLPFYILLSFIFGKQLYDFSRIPLEISLINPTVALIRNLITFLIPIVVGILAYKFHDGFKRYFGLLEVGEEDGSNNHNI